METSPHQRALRRAAAVLVSGADRPSADPEAMLVQLLQGRARVVNRGARFFRLQTDSPGDATYCRELLNMVAGNMGYPRMIIYGRAANQFSVYCLTPHAWRHLFLGVVGLLSFIYVTRFFQSTWWLNLLGFIAALAGIWGIVLIYRIQWRDRQRLNAILMEGQSLLVDEQQALQMVRSQVQRQSETWELLKEAERSFRHIASLAEIYPLLAQLLRRLIPDLDGLSVWRLDGAGEYLDLQYVEGRYAEEFYRVRRVTRTTGAIGHAIERQQPVVVAEISRDPRVYTPPGIEPSGSALALPLSTSEGPIGAFIVTRRSPGEFANATVWGAELLAGVAALRIHSLRAHDREQRLMEEFTRLHHLVSSHQEAVAVQDPMEQVGLSMAAAAGADGVLVYRLQRDGSSYPSCVHGLRPANSVRLQAIPLRESPGRLAVELGVISGIAKRDLAMWPEFTQFFVEAEAERCLALPVQRRDGDLLAAIVLIYRTGQDAQLTPERLALCDTYARYAGAAVHNLELYDTVRAQSAELRELLGRVVEAQERERSRIALDLHDWLVQGLAAPSFAIQAAGRLLDRAPNDARRELETAIQQLNRAADEMRRIMKGLHPHLLDELGLVEAVKAYAIEFSQAHGIKVRVSNEAETGPARGSQEALVAFRIIQEALNNVAKHAEASAVEIRLRTHDQLLVVRVADDGIGFDSWKRPASGQYGILGMQERAALVGGEVTISSRPGQGTALEIAIPLPVSPVS